MRIENLSKIKLERSFLVIIRGNMFMNYFTFFVTPIYF